MEVSVKRSVVVGKNGGDVDNRCLLHSCRLARGECPFRGHIVCEVSGVYCGDGSKHLTCTLYLMHEAEVSAEVRNVTLKLLREANPK